ARAPLAVPHCYFGAVDETSHGSVLLLQDLTPAQTGDQVAGMSVGRAELALRSLARLHAAWWQQEQAPEIQELAPLRGPAAEASTLVELFYRDTWPLFVDRLSGHLPPDVHQFGEHLIGRVAASEALLDALPRTLVHGDFRLENLLFGDHEGRPTCWVVDWE